MARSSTTFQKGFDPRRHIFTQEERKRGYLSMLATPMPSRTRAHIRRKIRATGKRKDYSQEMLTARKNVIGE